MGSTTEFNRISKLDGSYPVCIFLSKQGDSSFSDCFIIGDYFFLSGEISADTSVYFSFYFIQFFVIEPLEMTEIKSQAVETAKDWAKFLDAEYLGEM